MKKISEIKIGQKVSSFKYGKGMVCDKKGKTITFIFETGVKVKNTYRDISELINKNNIN